LRKKLAIFIPIKFKNVYFTYAILKMNKKHTKIEIHDVIEQDEKFVKAIKYRVLQYQFYDLNENFICDFEFFLWKLMSKTT